MHRVHDRGLPPNAFNPCQRGPTRFAPIRDSDGRCVPSLYAGGTLVSAIYETIFHDVPAQAERKTVPRYQIDRRSHGTLQLRRAIRLANLRAADLEEMERHPGGPDSQPPDLLPPDGRVGPGDPWSVPGGRRADLDLEPVRPRRRSHSFRRPYGARRTSEPLRFGTVVPMRRFWRTCAPPVNGPGSGSRSEGAGAVIPGVVRGPDRRGLERLWRCSSSPPDLPSRPVAVAGRTAGSALNGPSGPGLIRIRPRLATTPERLYELEYPWCVDAGRVVGLLPKRVVKTSTVPSPPRGPG